MANIIELIRKQIILLLMTKYGFWADISLHASKSGFRVFVLVSLALTRLVVKLASQIITTVCGNIR